MSNNINRGRPIPPQFKHRFTASFDRRLTFNERIKIMFGYNLRADVEIWFAHSPGQHLPRMTITTTKELPENTPSNERKNGHTNTQD